MTRVLSLLLCTLMLLTGCWDQRETNELAIVSGLGVDYVNGQYLVTVEIIQPQMIANPGQSGAAQNGPHSILVHGHGRTFAEALQEVNHKTSRLLFWAAMREAVIGRAAAEHGIAPVLLAFGHGPGMRLTPRVLIAQQSASEVFDLHFASIENATGLFLRLQSEMNHRQDSSGWAPRAYDLVRWLSEKDRAIVLLAVAARPHDRTAPYAMNENAVLINGRLTSFMPDHLARMVLWANGRMRLAVLPIPCPAAPEHIGSLMITQSHATRRLLIDRSGLRSVQLAFTASGIQLHPACPPNTYQEFDAAASRAVASELTAAVIWSQSHDADVFGIGEALFRENPVLWQRAATDWPKVWRTVPVRVEVQVHAKTSGHLRA